MIKGYLVINIIVVIFIFPWLFFYFQLETNITNLYPQSQVIVFGAIVHSDEVSPLHKERLNTAVMLYQNGYAREIIVSNTPQASLVMEQYLITKNVPPEIIKRDVRAEVTHQSCLNQELNESTIFISQSFHLPRILYECKLLGVNGKAFPAEISQSIERNASTWITIKTRTTRIVREMLLVWLDTIIILYRY